MLPASDYLYPRELQVTNFRFERVLFIGSCMTGDYIKYFREHNPDTWIEQLLFNNASQLPDRATYAPNEYQLQYIQTPLRHVIGDGIARFKILQQNADEVYQSAFDKLHAMLEAAMRYNKEYGILTLVQGFIVPQAEFVAGAADVGSQFDLRSLVRSLNNELARLTANYSNAFFLDADTIAGAIGKRYFLNDFIDFATHNSFWYADWNSMEQNRIEEVPHIETISPSHLSQFAETVWRSIDRIYRIANQIDQVKLVIFDLDDTMWRGIIGEHYNDNSGMVTDGWPHGMHEIVHHLAARGILTAVCSKNSPEIVRDRWGRAVPLGFISLEDFTFVEISWSPKVEAIARIIQDANLTPKSVVFVDDNPVEREAVQSAFPGIRCLAASPFTTRRVLLNAPETQVARVTAESAQRDTMLRQGKAREQARQTMSRGEFLLSLNCRVELSGVVDDKSPLYPRAFELLNKTNQFNTTGKRWNHAELLAFIRNRGEVYTFNVVDKFTSYGTVGVVLVRWGHIIEQFVMSCRVLGLDVEQTVLNAIMNVRLKPDDHPIYSAPLIHTEANLPCRDLYSKAGFRFEPENPEIFLLSIGSPQPYAEHLEVSIADEALAVAAPNLND